MFLSVAAAGLALAERKGWTHNDHPPPRTGERLEAKCMVIQPVGRRSMVCQLEIPEKGFYVVAIRIREESPLRGAFL